MPDDVKSTVGRKVTVGSVLHSSWEVVEIVAERLLTFCYHESLQRNTIEPLNRIIAASDDEARSRLLQEWADIKAEESKYIQIAVSHSPEPCSNIDLRTC
jgi:hypothetical protein